MSDSPEMSPPEKDEGTAAPSDPIERIEGSIASLKEWLLDNAPYCTSDQNHLDENSVERAYWHFGYLMALKDVRRLISESS